MNIIPSIRMRDLCCGLLLVMLLVLPAKAFAQSSLLEQLAQQEVLTELNISAAQVEKIEALREQMSDRSGIRELFQKSQQAETEQERDQIRQQMTNYTATRRQEVEEQLKSVLSVEQMSRLEQLVSEADGGDGSDQAGPAAPQAGGTAAQPEVAPPVEPGEVTASFGTSRRSAEDSPRDPDRLYFNFRNALWSDVLPLFAEAADLTLDLHAIPPGTFNHSDPNGYTVTEALDIINGYLLARGYILVRRDGGFLVSIRIDDPNGIPPNLIPTVSVGELPDRGRNELLTVVFPVTNDEDVDAVAEEVEKLVGPQGKVVGVKPTRSIVVTDIGANLARINALLRNVTEGPEDLVFKEYELHNILADDAEFIVRTLLGLSTDGEATGTAATSSNDNDDNDRRRGRGGRFGRFGGGFPFGQQQNPAPTTSGSSNRSNSKANTIADPRTNKLLVSATPSEHRMIEEAIQTVDVSERSPLASDRPYGSLGDKQMTVIPLANNDASQAALMLQSMFLKEENEAPTISADVAARRLIVRGTEAQLFQIKQLLQELGEDGSGQRTARNRGPVRTFSLSGRDPAELLPIVERMWSAQQGGRSSLNVIVPGEDDQSRRRNEILRGARERQQQPPVDPRPERSRRPQDSLEDDNRTQYDESALDDPFAVGTEADTDEGTSTVQGPPAGDLPADVTVRVVGDELMIISQDQEALDQLELMLENVMQAVPPRTAWSIFPLKSSDATEAAAMLEQLFPDSRVSQTSTASGGTLSTLTSGISTFGTGVADLTGLSDLGSGPQTLRIIPETRLNALWVSGPAYKVQEVEQMLEIIDASGLTDSLRDRVPRMIKVEHADIDDVFEIVSSVYAPELQATGGGNGNGDPRQAFASMFGGRRGGGRNGDNDRNAQPREPEVTLGVDRDTSHLIVSASEATFAEIEELVRSVDQASEASRRTVMVRQLINTNPSLMQDSLNSIIPKVSVSTSTSGSRPSTSSSNNRNRGNTSNSDDEATRRRTEFFQRMREQGGFGGGDRGGRGFGGRGFGGDRGGRGFGGDRGGRGR